MSLPPHSPPSPIHVSNMFSPMSWMIRDPQRFMALMQEAVTLVEGGYYFSDNLFTWARNNSMFDDLAFRRAWESNCLNDVERALPWRRYILATLAYHAVQLPGDFVECGTNAGTSLKTVVDYLGGPAFPKTFWGYDAFDVNPVKGTEKNFVGQGPGFYAEVQQRFAAYPQVKLIMGLIPGVFAQHCPERIAYLHIDLNNRDAEIAALETLFERVVPGGVIIFDDYEWSGFYRPQKLAEDVWLDRLQHRVVPLPTGQGFVIKH